MLQERKDGRINSEGGKTGKRKIDITKNMKYFLDILLTPSSPPAGDTEAAGVKERSKTGGPQQEGGEGGEEQGGLKLQILARGDLRVGAELSQRHHMYFILGESGSGTPLRILHNLILANFFTFEHTT